jgi:two-component system, OmpR family, heavy metal sensor histidine kinase CusS
MKKLSIGLRLTLWYLAIFAVAQLVFGAGMWVLLRHHLYDLVDDGLEGQLEDLKNFMGAQKKDASLAKLQEEVSETYLLEHSGDYLELHAENGELLYRSVFLQKHPVTLTPSRRSAGVISRNLRIDGHPFRFTLTNLQANGHVYTATMGASTDDVVETLDLFRSYLLAFAPLLFLVAAGGGYWLSRRALAPVDAIVRTARDISGANLSSRLQKLDTGDELQRLSDTLNEMLARIETAFLRVTEFTADASHELRTPVALIRTEAELALRRSRGEAEYQESLRQILLEAERTTTLIEQLLAVARADSGRETLDMQPVDLRETLRGVAQSWRQVADIRNVQFSARIDEQRIDEQKFDEHTFDGQKFDGHRFDAQKTSGQDLFVMGDRAALRRVADILLDNAFKYTASPGSVELSLEQQGERLVMAVHDSGVGIATEDQGKIFERFYRVDKARSREQGGAGLGLAIAQWIVTQHRGSIAVESQPGRGSIFRVGLPMIAAPVRNPQMA